MALTGLALAAALGLLKSEAVDRPKEDRQRKLAAETQRLSPWTGLKANPIKEADPFGTALEFGATGAMMGRGISNDNMNKALVAQQLAKGANAGGDGGSVNYVSDTPTSGTLGTGGANYGDMNAFPGYKPRTGYWTWGS